VHHPVAFMTALLNSFVTSRDKVSLYVQAARRMGIEVLPPDVNKSRAKFTADGDNIRFGLAAVKRVGVGAVDEIVRTRDESGPYTGFLDFCRRVPQEAINKGLCESLILAGAFDSFGISRSRMAAGYDTILSAVHNERKKNIAGQMSLFAMEEVFTTQETQEAWPNVPDFTRGEQLLHERDMTGVYISGHPLDSYTALVEKNTILTSDLTVQDEDEPTAEENTHVQDGMSVTFTGLLSEVKTKITKSATMMAFVQMEDFVGTVEVIVFPRTYQQYSSLLQQDGIVTVSGRITMREDEDAKIIADTFQLPVALSDKREEESTSSKPKKLFLRVASKEESDKLDRAKEIMLKHKGDVPVFIYFAQTKETFRMSEPYVVSFSDALTEKLQQIFGKESVKWT